MTGAARVRCTVAYATPARQHLWQVEVRTGSTVADVLAAARAACGEPADGVPWEGAVVGIHGQPCTRDAAVADGDRIELYRPLAGDPRERRRARVARARAGGATRR